MMFKVEILAFSGSLLLLMLAAKEVGLRLGRRHWARHPEDTTDGLGAVEGAVFGLLGLLVAFTFSGANARWDSRQGLINAEATAISSAYQYLDLVPGDAQPPLRALFRDYADARIAMYRAGDVGVDGEASDSQAKLRQAHEIYGRIWAQTVSASARIGTRANLLLAAVNAVSDRLDARLAATKAHPPRVIFALLYALSIAAAALAGFGMARGRSGGRLHGILFAAITAGVCLVILDIEYPRAGWIHLAERDDALVSVRAAMSD